MTEKQEWGCNRFVYTRKDLEMLTECIELNGGSCMMGLSVFCDEKKITDLYEALTFWGRFAERISRGIDEVKKFDEMQASVPQEVWDKLKEQG